MSECRKLIVRQLFGPNLAVFQGTKFGVPLGRSKLLPPLKMALLK